MAKRQAQDVGVGIVVRAETCHKTCRHSVPPSPLPGAQVTTRAETTYSKTLSRNELIALLKLPKDAALTFRVPGGGDYSNCTLSVDDVGGLKVEWRITQMQEGE